MTDRYDDKPFLRLLDAYVLDAIGALGSEQDAALAALEPHFRDIFGATGNWRTIVVARMQFPDGMAGAIREVWDKGRGRFVEANGVAPDPAEFTRIFVDTNFPH